MLIPDVCKCGAWRIIAGAIITEYLRIDDVVNTAIWESAEVLGYISIKRNK